MKRKPPSERINFQCVVNSPSGILNYIKFSVVALCLITSTLSMANALDQLKSFEAEFVAFRSGNDVGTAVLSVNDIDNDRYELVYKSKLSRFFLSDKRYEKTIFVIEDEQFVPLVYEYKRSGTGPNKSLSLTFDQNNKRITINDKDELEWAGEFDNQLFRIDLPRQLSNGIFNTSYDFINYRGEKRNYKFLVLGEEHLSLPYGKLKAIKLKIERESNSRVTYAWFAPSLGHNLVRLQQFKDDKEQGDIKLNAFTYL